MSDPTTAYSSAPVANPPADWYPDPTGEGQMRWWGGLAWTEHVKPFPPPAPAPAPLLPAPTATASYVPMDSTYVPFGASAAPASPTRVTPTRMTANTIPIWILAVLPLPYVIAQLIVLVSPFEAWYPVGVALATVLFAVFIGLVVWDRVALSALGLTPSSIWWLLLPSPIVYLIVRRVTLKRQGVISNAPSNVFVLVLVGSAVLANLTAVPLVNAAAARASVITLENQLALALQDETSTVWKVGCPPASPIFTPNSQFKCIAGDTKGHAIDLLVTLDSRLNVTYQYADHNYDQLSS